MLIFEKQRVCHQFYFIVLETLWDPTDCNPPGSFVHRVLQARITGVGCPCPPPGIFLTQGPNHHLLSVDRCVLYYQRHLGSPEVILWWYSPLSQQDFICNSQWNHHVYLIFSRPLKASDWGKVERAQASLKSLLGKNELHGCWLIARLLCMFINIDRD